MKLLESENKFRKISCFGKFKISLSSPTLSITDSIFKRHVGSMGQMCTNIRFYSTHRIINIEINIISVMLWLCDVVCDAVAV